MLKFVRTEKSVRFGNERRMKSKVEKEGERGKKLKREGDKGREKERGKEMKRQINGENRGREN